MMLFRTFLPRHRAIIDDIWFYLGTWNNSKSSDDNIGTRRFRKRKIEMWYYIEVYLRNVDSGKKQTTVGGMSHTWYTVGSMSPVGGIIHTWYTVGGMSHTTHIRLF